MCIHICIYFSAYNNFLNLDPPNPGANNVMFFTGTSDIAASFQNDADVYTSNNIVAVDIINRIVNPFNADRPVNWCGRVGPGGGE